MSVVPAKSRKRTPAVIVGMNVTGLGVVRALVGQNIPLIGVDCDLTGAAARTRYCAKVCSPSLSDERLVQVLLELASSQDSKPVLIPAEDLAVLVISGHREKLAEAYRFELPDRDVVNLLMSKRLFHDFAVTHRFAVPRTYFPSSAGEMKGVSGSVRYPCIIKPVTRGESYNRYSPSKAFQAADPEELMSTYGLISNWESQVVVQEFIPGPDSAVHFCLMLFDEERCLASVTGRKLRQWHPVTGSTSSAESVELPEVQEEAIRLFREIRYRGLGSVEFKYDVRDSSYKVIEPTVGRPDWQSYLAVASGVNIPYLYYCSLLSETRTAGRVRYGVKWVHEENDFKSAIHYLLRREMSPGSWFRSLRGPRSYAFFSWRDPLPFLALLREMAGKGFRSIMRKRTVRSNPSAGSRP